MEIDQITGAIVNAAMKVHSALGPGLLESVYERCLAHELTKLGLKVCNQVWVPVVYDGIEIEGGYKIDLLVEDVVIVELKVVEHILEIHKAQLLSYLKLSGKQVGLIINFNVVRLRDGIKRIIKFPPNLCVLSVLCGFGFRTPLVHPLQSCDQLLGEVLF